VVILLIVVGGVCLFVYFGGIWMVSGRCVVFL